MVEYKVIDNFLPEDVFLNIKSELIELAIYYLIEFIAKYLITKHNESFIYYNLK